MGLDWVAIEDVTPAARFGEHLAGHRGQFERFVEFAIVQHSDADVTTDPRN
jgi:hypothetical protein